MKYYLLLQFFALAVINAIAGPPEPREGFRWVINDQYSDEFNGTSLDTDKWNDKFTLGWKGRKPARFEPSSVSVKEGNLRIKNGVLTNPSNGYTIAGGAVSSVKQTAHFGYYECNFRASKIPMSTTFWMSNKKEKVVGTTNQGVDCPGDEYRQELDIQESIGGAPDNRKSFRTDMHFNTHYRYIACGGGNDIFHSAGNNSVEGNGAKANSKLSSEVWEAFHTYGAYWKNAKQVSFYADNKFAGDVNVKQTIVDNPFDRPMGINMVTETYDWLTNNGVVPTTEQLNNDDINTSYYNWVRSYKLVPADEVVSVNYSGIYNQEIKYYEEPSLIGNDKVSLSYTYKANKALELTVFVYEEGKEAVASQTINLPRGYGKVQKDIALGKTLPAGDYKFYAEMKDGGNLISSIGTKPSVSTVVDPTPSTGVTIKGELRKWHKITLDFEGEDTLDESVNTDNPFLNYRLDVTFTNDAKSITVPGYFAADGNAANSGASKGKVWRVHFNPDAIGTWTYKATFYKGANVAIAADPSTFTTDAKIHNATGTFSVQETDKVGRDMRARGRLKYVNQHHLRFEGSGEYFVKAGPDSPENLLAYKDFDNTGVGGKSDLMKDWSPHVKDWKTGDPTWKSGKGKGLIGAVNYLAEEKLNSMSFITMNAPLGDDRNVVMWIDKNKQTQYDCSKLDQWQIVFDHAQKKGIHLHFKTQETENELILDNGNVGTERKLYYRELVARFGYLNAMEWNICEEGGARFSKTNQTQTQRKASIEYLANLDPYKNNVVLHTAPNLSSQKLIYNDMLGTKSKLTGVSLQNEWDDVFETTLHWVEESAANGRKWIVANDEQGNAQVGVPHDDYAGKPNKEDIRKETLWGNLMAGGAGVNYYFGYGGSVKVDGKEVKIPLLFDNSDIRAEDFRTRDISWDYCRYAVKFMDNYIPFWDMKNDDSATSTNNNHCLSKEGEVYVVYFKNGGTTNLKLPAGTYNVDWYNPKTGGDLVEGLRNVSGGGSKALGAAPASGDWIALVRSTTFIHQSQKGNGFGDETTTPTPPTPPMNDACMSIKAHDFENIAVSGFDNAAKNVIPDSPADGINKGEPVIGATSTRGLTNPIAAETTYTGATKKVVFKVKAVGEPDGEPTYAVYVNGTKVGEKKSTRIFGTTTPPYTYEDLIINTTAIEIKSGDIIRVTSTQVSNNLVPEGTGFATARGRWSSLEICESDEGDTTPPPPPIDDCKEKVFIEKNGEVAIEAEDFVSQELIADREWYVFDASTTGTPTPDPDGNHAVGASGGKYIELLPDTRVVHADASKPEGGAKLPAFSNVPGKSSILNYKVKFSSAGKYFVWVRAYATGTEDNGIHVGIDGTWPDSGARMQWCQGKNQWTWESKQRTAAEHCGEPMLIFINVPSAGLHTISFSMREDGFEMDKIILSKTYTKPTGTGLDAVYEDCDNSTPAPKDCNGDEGGTATESCGVCWGGNTGIPKPDKDNDGILDCDDTCPEDDTNTCNNPTPTPNKPPKVSIKSPLSTDVFEEGESFTVDVEASDEDGTIATYEIFINGSLEDTDPGTFTPYKVNNLVVGMYTVKVVVTDNDGATAEAEMQIDVKAKGTPLPKDCHGDEGGTATESCGICWGGNTSVAKPDKDNDGILDCDDTCPDDATDSCNNPAPKDCNGDEGGTATESCGICWGGNTSVAKPDKDNDGILDCDDTCPDDATDSCNTPAPKDCNGDEGGTATKTCGICWGGNTGIAKPDKDNDGILDCDDTCPDDATDTCNNPVVPNVKPNLKIIAPSNLDNLVKGDTVVIDVDASDIDGAIVSYKIYVNEELKESYTNKFVPFEMSSLDEGEYDVKVVVEDDNGATVESNLKVVVQNDKEIIIPAPLFEAMVFPNPFGLEKEVNLVLLLDNDQDVNVELFSINGKLLFRKHYKDLIPGENIVKLDMRNYISRKLVLAIITNSNGMREVIKIVN